MRLYLLDLGSLPSLLSLPQRPSDQINFWRGPQPGSLCGRTYPLEGPKASVQPLPTRYSKALIPRCCGDAGSLGQLEMGT